MLTTPDRIKLIANEIRSDYFPLSAFLSQDMREALLSQKILKVVTIQDESISMTAADISNLRDRVRDYVNEKFCHHWFG